MIIEPERDKSLDWWWVLLGAEYKNPEVKLVSKDNMARIKAQVDFGLGERQETKLKSFEFLTMDGFEEKDCIISDDGNVLGLLFSHRLKEFLDKEGVNNIQYFNAKVKDGKTGDLYEYYLANIIGTSDAIDKEESELEFVYEIDLVYIEELCFDEDILNKQELRILRMEDVTTLIAVKGELKIKLEKEEFTGLHLFLPEDWHEHVIIEM